MKIINVFGPNLNLLGYRKKNHYGLLTFDKLNLLCSMRAKSYNFEYEHFISNSETELINFFQSFIFNKVEDVVFIINLGAFTHYSYAIGDCLEVLSEFNKLIEVHLSNIYEREEFRSFSVVKMHATKQFYGNQENSYLQAIDFIKVMSEHE